MRHFLPRLPRTSFSVLGRTRSNLAPDLNISDQSQTSSVSRDVDQTGTSEGYSTDYFSSDFSIVFGNKLPADLSLAVLGTCIAESFVKECVSQGYHADHYLLRVCPEVLMPYVQWGGYDAALVHITLRQLTWGLVKNGDDLFHVRTLSDDEYLQILASVQSKLECIVQKISKAIDGRIPIFFLSFTEPPSTYQGVLINNRKRSFYHFIRSLNDTMSEAMTSLQSSYYIESNDLLNYYGSAKASDAFSVHFSHAGIRDSKEGGRIYSRILTRLLVALSILRKENSIKLIITDLDNTLWKGVVAECDELIPHEHTEGWPLGYVEALLEFKRRGGLLAISSKNDSQDTLKRFEVLWRNRLSIEDFCSVKINWKPKSQNIKEILAETNILASSALFIDDNPLEIDEAKRSIPGIRTLSGKPETWRNAILYAPNTQVSAITEESKLRTDMVKAKIQRDSLPSTMSRDAYLASLHIHVTFYSICSTSDPHYERSLELINKTNQFNTTGKRWDPSDMLDFFRSDGFIVALSSRDDFGDNGLVALAIVRDGEIIQCVMSCRVFGFGLETALLCRVTGIIRVQDGKKTISSRLVNTGKNKSCASFFRDNGFVQSENAVGTWELRTPPAWPSWIGEN